jgi:glycosyltransferase involved in cell wall biosynthesis
MLTSVIIRTFNEQKFLGQLLTKLEAQDRKISDLEIVIVDSGSTDKTLDIAERHGCRMTHIPQSDFTFGRSLNYGCRLAKGNYLAFISGHCLPVNNQWLDELVRPLHEGSAAYVYGRQQAAGTTRFSEKCHFEKWFPDYPKIPQNGYFCNNANSAILRTTWESNRFDEELTGLEDMFLAKRLVEQGEKIAYAASASVYHIHEERWQQVKIRYEREAIALQRIMPEVHFSMVDFVRYYSSSVLSDVSAALGDKILLRKFGEIIMFRLMQFWGTYRGNHEHRRLSMEQKRHYFYPKDLEKHVYESKKDRGFVTDESQ